MPNDQSYLFSCHITYGWEPGKSTCEMAPVSLILTGVLSPVPMTDFPHTEQTSANGKGVSRVKDNIVTKHCILVLLLKIWRNPT